MIFGLGIAAIGILLLSAPSLLGMDMMSGGYAVRFIGLFVTLCGLVVAWFYQARSAVLDHMLTGQGVLAHWTYDASEYRRQVDREYTERSQDNRNLLKLTAVIMLIVYAAVFIVPILRGEDVWPLVLVLYFGLLLILAIFALGAPWLAHRHAVQASPDVYISQEGVYVLGGLHTWKQPFWQLKRVRLDAKGDKTALEFDMRYLTRLGWVRYETTTLCVPVPAGQTEAAEHVVHFFGERHPVAGIADLGGHDRRRARPGPPIPATDRVHIANSCRDPHP
jgi:hypothetical protein